MSHLVAYVDGGARAHPGRAGVGVVIEHPGGARVEISECLGALDNNGAEYAALLMALEYAAACDCSRLQVFSDSEVVVRQIRGLYSCQSPALRPLYESCRARIESLEDFRITHIRREHNQEANRLVQAAIARAQRKLAKASKAAERGPEAAAAAQPGRWHAALSRAAQRAAARRAQMS